MTLAQLIEAIERQAEAQGLNLDQVMKMEITTVAVTVNSNDVAISVEQRGQGKGRLYLDRQESIPGLAVMGITREVARG